MKVTGKAHLYGAVSGGSAGMTLEDALTSLNGELAAEAQTSDIMEAHLAILEDPLLVEHISSGIAHGLSPEKAVNEAGESLAAMFTGIDDEYLRARADDVRDICRRLEMKLRGESMRTDIPEGCILVAEELLPSDMAAIDLTRVRGISCHRGSSTGHVAIMARAMGIPAAFGNDHSGLTEGAPVTVDDPTICSSMADRIRASGCAVYVNAGSLEDIERAIMAGADGIGLFRTEFLYLSSPEAPSFELQKDIYRRAMEYCTDKVLTVRTIDIGGDKPVPWLPIPAEGNPFLGLRGIRFSLDHPDLLKTQLEALAWAAEQVPGCQLRIMFPMVCSVSEVAQAKSLLGERAESLTFGAMIETPAAALSVESLCSECSFFSIGSNDLTQYVMAADRGNPAVAPWYDPMSPPMRLLIEKTVTDAHRCGATVGICGEAASDPASLDYLLKVGLDSLSLNRL